MWPLAHWEHAVTFMSKCWGDHISDRFLTLNSGLLKLIKYGDLVLADKGFDIGEDLALIGASLMIPSFTRGKLNYHKGKSSSPENFPVLEYTLKEP